MTHPITATMLYNLTQCPTRVALDLFEDPAKQDAVSKFVELLWERGTTFESELIAELTIPFVDLRGLPSDEREEKTTDALARGEQLICGGRIEYGRLLGEPDLLQARGGGYVAGDIKSGAGEEGASDFVDGKPKKHYAVQLCLYTDILVRLNLATGYSPFIWDIHGNEVTYDLHTPQGPGTPETLWDYYDAALSLALHIAEGAEVPPPALGGKCKLCHWRSLCRTRLERSNDLTLVPDLGRARRDAMVDSISTVAELATVDVAKHVHGEKTTFSGVGPAMLYKLQQRAQAQVEKSDPYLTGEVRLPDAEVELFFDVETDPMRDLCYLHGFVERINGDSDTEKFHAFFADEPTAAAEERAFRDAYEYLTARMPCAVYVYSKYERTTWKNLAKKYPSVVTEDQILTLFGDSAVVDLLYDVVVPKTVWPTHDHSIKTLASYLGFEWRDESPSGAESIEWYHRLVDSGDAWIKQRILEYNEDDCRAMRVLVDALRRLTVCDQ